MNAPTISPLALLERYRHGEEVTLIDVRTPAEFQQLHVAFARNVPLDRLDPSALGDVLPSAQKPIYIVCQSGSRGRQACQQLLSAGYSSVWNVEGGTLACERTGLPVVRGRATMSLERQVRIAAGLLVVLSVALGWLVHPAFYGLAALVGGGLVFAGITDTCGMAMLLANMPWNHVTEVATENTCQAGQRPSPGSES